MRGFVGYRLRAEARTGWSSWVLVAVVVGVVGGIAIGLVAGARRTETAHARFLERTHAFDVLFTNGGTNPENLNRVFDFDEIAALPAVHDAVSLQYYFPAGTKPSGDPLGGNDLMPVSSPDGRFGTTLNGSRLISGRLPVESHEIAVSVLAARQLGLGVGDSLDVTMQPADPTAAGEGDPPPSAFTTVGIIAMQGGLPPKTGGVPPMVLLAPGYAEDHPGGAEVIVVRLDGGSAGVAAFQRDLSRLAEEDQFVVATQTEMARPAERGPAAQATALRALAGVVIAATVLLALQALARQRAADRVASKQLVALGATAADLRTLASARTALVAGGAGIIAALVAVGVSPFTLVGSARDLEAPGIEANVAYIALGALIVFLAMVLASAVAGGVAPQRIDDPTPVRPSRLTAVGGAAAPVSAALGLRQAGTRGRGAVARANRVTMLTGAVGLAAIVAVGVFATSLGRLFDDPVLYGWSWDLQVGDQFARDLTDEASALEGQSGVAAVALATNGKIDLGGEDPVDAIAIQARQGTIAPVVVEGRAPSDSTDLLLGSKTLRRLGFAVGDRVSVGSGAGAIQMEIVGRGVLPEFASGAGLGEGAAVTLEGFRRIAPAAEADTILLRFTDDAAGAARSTAVTDASIAAVYRAEQPSDLADLERLRSLPALLVGVIGLAALGTLAHALWTSVAERRRDLASYKALGLTGRQVAAVMAWHSVVVVLKATALGLPLGVVAGRMAWGRFANDLGVPPVAEVPILLVGLLVPLAAALALLVALGPAIRARRTPAGQVLRAY